jgi:prefoldin subunit 5
MSLDPSQRKYAGNTPYNFVLNSPLQAIDPDGKDIIVLCDVDGVHGAGHQALLIGDEEHGWTYISKDGAEKSGNAFGRSRFTVQTFKNLQEFRNSPHNFDLVEGDNHSNVGGKTKAGKDMIFLLKDGKKIQRYEKAYRIYTTKIDGISTDQKSIDAAIKECKKDYQLSMSDCSDAVTSALNVAKDHTGKQVRNGENNWTVLLCFALRGVTETPVSKQANIAERNSGESCNSAIKPDNCNLSNGEKGVESKKQ